MSREFNIGGIRFRRCSGIMIHSGRICPRRRRQKFVASSLPVRGNLPARGNFFCTRRTGNIFRSLAKPRQIRDPRDVYIYPLAISLHKFCLSSLFFPASFSSNSWKSNGRTMAAYPRPVNLRSTIINFHYVTIVFLPNLENIYTGKNVSSRTMNNFYVTLSCSLVPFCCRCNRWKLDDTYSGWFSIRFCVSLKF